MDHYLDFALFSLMDEIEMLSNSALIALTLFDGSNFESWQDHMLQVLRKRGLHNPLDGVASRSHGVIDN